MSQFSALLALYWTLAPVLTVTLSRRDSVQNLKRLKQLKFTGQKYHKEWTNTKRVPEINIEELVVSSFHNSPPDRMSTVIWKGNQRINTSPHVHSFRIQMRRKHFWGKYFFGTKSKNNIKKATDKYFHSTDIKLLMKILANWK